MSDVPAYARQQTREGPLPLSTKLFQAVGAWPEVFKGLGFGLLLLYYGTVLGLPVTWAALALGIATFVDGAVDPLIGSWSDNLRHRLGRRHPLMYASVLPLGLSLYAVFAPPSGLSHPALFAWLLASTIAVHATLSLFVVPWTAMYAELTDRYEERTVLVAWRYALGWIGGLGFGFLVFPVLFAATTAFPQGQLNPDSYRGFAPVLAISVALSALLATHLTRREVPYLIQPIGPVTPFSLGRLWREVTAPFGNGPFVILFASALISAALTGITTALTIYMQTYFWRLAAADLAWFGLTGIGAAAGFLIAPWAERRLDKVRVLQVCFALSLIDGVIVVGLRLAGVLPENGDPALLPILVAATSFGVFLTTLLGIMFISMLADALDWQELTTGRRQEGMFAAGLSFSTKATAGIGTLAAGLLLAHIIRWPQGAGASPEPDAIVRLGLVVGFLVPALYLVPFAMSLRYRLTREAHAEIRAKVDERRAAI